MLKIEVKKTLVFGLALLTLSEQIASLSLYGVDDIVKEVIAASHLIDRLLSLQHGGGTEGATDGAYLVATHLMVKAG
jgi:hypothetical protein